MELTTEILKEKGISLDLKKYGQYFDEHVKKSKKKTAFNKKVDKNIPIYKKVSGGKKTEFLGYEKEQLTTTITGIIRLSEDGTGESADELDAGERGEVLLKTTVFYGEKGGQSGDKGLIKTGGGIFIVNDTQIPLEDTFIHRGYVKEGKIRCNEKADIEINHKRRSDTKKNHTSTHLLHWALRNLLGDQAKQSGSFVTDNRLRFDYSVYNTLDREQLRRIEKMVNEKIQRDDSVRCFETTMDYARELDAVALFDEKYGKFVRVVEIDDYNRELCGGTHVARTGEIGLFKIVSDSSIGANLRRIEAVTGMQAFDILSDKEERLKKISEILEVNEDSAEDAVTGLKDDSQRLEEELEKLRIGMVTDSILNMLENIKPVNSINMIDLNINSLGLSPDITAKDMGSIVDSIKGYYRDRNTFIVLGNIYNDKPVLLLACTTDIAGKRIDCGKMARQVGKIIKGGGGGRPDFAQLGGSDAGSLEKAISFALELAGKALFDE